MSSVNRYPKQVFWSDEDEGYIAVAPDLPGSSAFGETEQEALEELDCAIEAWIEAAQAAGNPIPKPSSPAKDLPFSGKTVVRMPKSLHAQLAHDAQFEGVSLNQHINRLLSASTAANAVERNVHSAIDGLLETIRREIVPGRSRWRVLNQHVLPTKSLNLGGDHWTEIEGDDYSLPYDMPVRALPSPHKGGR